MTIRSDMTMPGTLLGYRAKEQATAKLSAAIASRFIQLQSAWMRRVGRYRLARSIAHLDDRLLADIGLSAQDLGFIERVARSRATRDGRHLDGQLAERYCPGE
jgi:uncharacterized protein YjiS (DUF1127 family)